MIDFPPSPIQTAGQLSAHLKSLRKALGLTQAQLGERIGVKQVRIADIERDPGVVSVAQLLELIHALDARLLIAKQQGYAPPAPSGPLTAKEPGPRW